MSDGLIPKADYEQAFEETCMSIIEGLIKHAKKADINEAPLFMKKWIDFYWERS